MASLWKLPTIYCCENNSWAQFSPQNLTTKIIDVASRASAYDIPGVIVDGDDVIAVYEAARESVERARKGDGPTLLECKTHRWYGHYVGDPQKYRSKEEIEGCRKFDPIVKLETNLVQEGILTSKDVEEIKDKARVEIEEAIEFAQETPEPQGEEALEDVLYEGGE
jgi:pyruvate dehydrogenase E1 component alpha subunit